MPQVPNAGINLITIIRRWFSENIPYNVEYMRWDFDHVMEDRPDFQSLLTVRIRIEIQENERNSHITRERICSFFAHKCIVRRYVITNMYPHIGQTKHLYIASPTFFDDLKTEIDSTITDLINAGCILEHKKTYAKC
jgi:hypothetical protein